MRGAFRYLLLAWLAAPWLAYTPMRGEDISRANAVVQASAYVSLDPVPRERTFDVAVMARILPGFHINAHKTSFEYLIPTALDAQLPPGFRALDTTYPTGVLRQFKFSPEKLSVYEGTVTVRMKLQALPDAPLGANKIPMTLHYQACNEVECLLPVKLAVAAELEIAPAGAAARPVHPEIFPARPSR